MMSVGSVIGRRRLAGAEHGEHDDENGCESAEHVRPLPSMKSGAGYAVPPRPAPDPMVLYRWADAPSSRDRLHPRHAGRDVRVPCRANERSALADRGHLVGAHLAGADRQGLDRASRVGGDGTAHDREHQGARGRPGSAPRHDDQRERDVGGGVARPAATDDGGTKITFSSEVKAESIFMAPLERMVTDAVEKDMETSLARLKAVLAEDRHGREA